MTLVWVESFSLKVKDLFRVQMLLFTPKSPHPERKISEIRCNWLLFENNIDPYIFRTEPSMSIHIYIYIQVYTVKDSEEYCAQERALRQQVWFQKCPVKHSWLNYKKLENAQVTHKSIHVLWNRICCLEALFLLEHNAPHLLYSVYDHFTMTLEHHELILMNLNPYISFFHETHVSGIYAY